MNKLVFENLKKLDTLLNIVDKLTLLNQIEFFENLKDLLVINGIDYLSIPLDINNSELEKYIECCKISLNMVIGG